ncbi:hypothetical protein VTJ04DRAFT_91 [Mycothermus thermophilus]|uniref:uncharacterized protein n=1 Tax=Humicola insolens TaxID=85995 RepID=UPI0037420A40
MPGGVMMMVGKRVVGSSNCTTDSAATAAPAPHEQDRGREVPCRRFCFHNDFSCFGVFLPACLISISVLAGFFLIFLLGV